ncbi:MAG: Uncharacterised protein [Flavobacteriia bacterium]|nr:MAG: Uncharacterised protein [Flavobacteriia bacterium]
MQRADRTAQCALLSGSSPGLFGHLPHSGGAAHGRTWPRALPLERRKHRQHALCCSGWLVQRSGDELIWTHTYRQCLGEHRLPDCGSGNRNAQSDHCQQRSIPRAAGECRKFKHRLDRFCLWDHFRTSSRKQCANQRVRQFLLSGFSERPSSRCDLLCTQLCGECSRCSLRQ